MLPCAAVNLSTKQFTDPNYDGEGVDGMWMTIIALIGLVVNLLCVCHPSARAGHSRTARVTHVVGTQQGGGRSSTR